MSRRPAAFTQADVARIIRAAKQAGASKAEVRIGDQATVLIHLSTASDQEPEPKRDIVL